MVAKSIIQIDVDDAKFKEFQTNFSKYQEALKKLPGSWGKTDAAVEVTGDRFFEMTAALMAQNELLHKATLEHEKAAKATSTAGRALTVMKRDSYDLLGNIKGITESLLKWGTIIGGGLLAGSILGLDRLTGSIAGQAKLSRQVGASAGQLSAFKLDYGQVIDADSVVGNIANIESYPYNTAGIRGDVIAMQRRGMSTTDIAAAILPKALRLFKASGSSQQGMQAYGLDALGSYSDYRALAAAQNDPTLQKMMGKYPSDSRALSLSRGDQDAYAKFNRQLEFSADKLEVFAAKAIEPLILPMEKLSEDVLNYLKTPQFLAGIQEFARDIPVVADGMKKWAQWMGLLPSDSSTSAKPPAIVKKWNSNFSTWENSAPLPIMPSLSPWGKEVKGAFSDPGSALKHWFNTTQKVDVDAMKPQFNAIEDANGLPRGTLAKLAYSESSGRTGGVNQIGAAGMFQIMPATAKAYGLNDSTVQDPLRAGKAMGAYLGDLQKQLGDTHAAILAYKAHGDEVRALQRAYGRNWEQHAPQKLEVIVHNFANTSVAVVGQQVGSK